MSQREEAQPVQANIRGFVEGKDDVTGYLALAFYIKSIQQDSFVKVISSQMSSISDHDIYAFRASAKEAIDKYLKRSLESQLEQVRSSATLNIYNEVMRSNYDNLLSEQQRGFDKTIFVVERATNTSKQILISVVSSFVFGLLILGASSIDNPVKFLQHWFSDGPAEQKPK